MRIPDLCEIWIGSADINQDILCVTCINESRKQRIFLKYKIDNINSLCTLLSANFVDTVRNIQISTPTMKKILPDITNNIRSRRFTSAVFAYGGHSPETYRALVSRGVSRERIEKTIDAIEQDVSNALSST